MLLSLPEQLLLTKKWSAKITLEFFFCANYLFWYLYAVWNCKNPKCYLLFHSHKSGQNVAAAHPLFPLSVSATVLIIHWSYMSKVGAIHVSTTQIRYTPRWEREKDFCVRASLAAGRRYFTSNMLAVSRFTQKSPQKFSSSPLESSGPALWWQYIYEATFRLNNLTVFFWVVKVLSRASDKMKGGVWKHKGGNEANIKEIIFCRLRKRRLTQSSHVQQWALCVTESTVIQQSRG